MLRSAKAQRRRENGTWKNPYQRRGGLGRGPHSGPYELKQLFNLMLAKVDKREGAAGRAWQGSFDIEAEALVDGGDHFGGFGGPFGGIAAGRVTLADRAATLNAAASE